MQSLQCARQYGGMQLNLAIKYDQLVNYYSILSCWALSIEPIALCFTCLLAAASPAASPMRPTTLFGGLKGCIRMEVPCTQINPFLSAITHRWKDKQTGRTVCVRSRPGTTSICCQMELLFASNDNDDCDQDDYLPWWRCLSSALLPPWQ